MVQSWLVAFEDPKPLALKPIKTAFNSAEIIYGWSRGVVRS